jgi:transposase
VRTAYKCRAYADQVQASAYLTAMKATGELAWLNEVSSVPLQQAIRHQQAAYAAFFAKRARYPRFKSRQGRQCAEYTRSGFRWRDGRLFLAKMDAPLAFTWSWPGIDLAAIVIDRWFPSSKTCSACGYLLAALSLDARHWQCPSCGTRHDRDVNAAKNILAAGLAVAGGNPGHACGADVRHSGSSRVQPAVKQETQGVSPGIPVLQDGE